MGKLKISRVIYKCGRFSRDMKAVSRGPWAIVKRIIRRKLGRFLGKILRKLVP